jgi:hypothetical protein
MASYKGRVADALTSFDRELAAFVATVAGTAPHPRRLAARTKKAILEIADRARTASAAIDRSMFLIEATALDLVDMQVRLQGETARLAGALRDLGNTVADQPFVRTTFESPLVRLDEAAQLVAAAVFPSAVRGLREVNVTLWDFEKNHWKRYTELLSDVIQRDRIPSDQQVRVQAIADDVARAFDEVNTLLNDLAETRAADAAVLRRRLRQAPERLRAALRTASDRLAASESRTLTVFGPVIRASAKTAEEVAALLQKLTIPVFPVHGDLGPCCDVVPAALYDDLSGVQAFALLNILARIQATSASGRSLLDGRGITIRRVFPDRIYFEASHSIIADIGGDPAFEAAPASLHQFKDGSFKQTTFRKGNLQICFAKRPNDRVMIDADVDLYRSAVPHLFGEVLVNHLTGNTTSQFAVRAILDDQRIPSIGGFQLLQA